ncbi:Nitrate assimilation regulatory protein nirA [Pleurostoma richardsiae]|uniref:Nitrate assimilation regulatory protein nirA n=1 Tax=Pleurostoma richardsiae TaxID=41990 RepID=A0AA38RYI2_9PEZI|nr:Nitrate assimilation regulatory protein nirA [Pleurostoma richardsiae]
MSSFRTIRPMPASGGGGGGGGGGDRDQDQDQDQSAGPSLPRLNRVTHACLACRQHKSKCDGARPTCRMCRDKGRDCEYRARVDQAGFDAVKARMEALENLINTLRVSPPDTADGLFRRIRSAADLPSLLQSQEEDVAGEHGGQVSDRVGMTLDPPAAPSQESLLELGALSIPSEDVAQRAVDAFFTLSSKLFHVFSREQAAHLHDVVFGDGNVDAKQRKGATCCLFAIAAVGTQYLDGEFSLAAETAIYNVARLFFEEAQELHPLEAVKVATLLAQYNIFGKATVALSYVETGLSMAKRCGLYGKRSPDQRITTTQWIDYRKTWRTLIFFENWLCSTLGYDPGNDMLTGHPQLSVLDVDNSPDLEDIVQTEMAKIAMLKVNILRMQLSFRDLSVLSTETITKDLQDWYGQLPHEMRLSNLGCEDLPVDLRRSIYFVNLLYLGAIMLLYRRIVYQFVRSFNLDKDRDILPRDFDKRLGGPAEQSVLAAKHSTRILALLMSENGVFRRCWLVIFQSYMACIAIMHSVTQKQLHGMPPADWQEDLEQASQCLDVLAYCGSLDSVAFKFHDRLISMYKKVSNPPPPARAGVTPDGPYGAAATASAEPPLSSGESSPWLLSIPPDSDPERADLSLSLLHMLCVPFDDPELQTGVDALVKVGWKPDPTCYEPPQMIERLEWEVEGRAVLRISPGKLDAAGGGSSGSGAEGSAGEWRALGGRFGLSGPAP